MQNRPLVSIALATYNGERFLRPQLDSLVAQDYPNLEIVISDDCSTDGTWPILQEYAARDSRIRLLDRASNLGYVHNFARVFGATKGSLISPSDQDDTWHPSKTSRLVDAMGDAQLIYCNNRYVDSEGKSLGFTGSDIAIRIEGNDPRNLLMSTSICGHAMIFRRSLLDIGHGLTEAPYIDWWIAFVAANVGIIKYLDEALVDYRQNSHSVWGSVCNRGGSAIRHHTLWSDSVRLRTFAEFPGPYQAYCKTVRDAWHAWYDGYFSPRMFFLMLREAPVTHRAALKNCSRWFIPLKYMVGHKLKRLLIPSRYLPMQK